jgi:hypothetical protein
MSKMQIVIESPVRVCPGRRHAWFNSNAGLVRKPIKETVRWKGGEGFPMHLSVVTRIEGVCYKCGVAMVPKGACGEGMRGEMDAFWDECQKCGYAEGR